MPETEITTKAAKCPKCDKYHLICCIELFSEDEEVQKEFQGYMKDGFDIVSVTTDDAKSNYGSC